MDNQEYSGGDRGPKRYRGKVQYCPRKEDNLKSLVQAKKSFSKDRKENWERLREEMKKSQENCLAYDFDVEVWTYAQVLCDKKNLDFLKALDMASERIGKLREEVSSKYPRDNPQLKAIGEKAYYSKLLELFTT